ncbi:class I adenylate-forming enzyme family protein [Nocardia sp. NPDC059691]|uniref:class I adenylate-forming enzyme family protein n=1 Tax=Nocardia sp. NPDC059691 TaxID=3346908 RepID=UPI00367F3B55
MLRPYVWNPWETATAVPDRPAVIVGSDVCTFGELTSRADALGRGLAAAGITGPAVLATDLPTGPRLFATVLAALRYGYGLLLLDRGYIDVATADELRASTGASVLITDSSGSSRRSSTIVDDDLVAVRTASAAFDFARIPAGRLIFTSSGTTGAPTALAGTLPRLPFRGVAVEQKYGAGLSWGPHLMTNPAFHLGTLGPALYALQAGSTVVVQQHWSAELFAALVDLHAVDTTMLSPDRLVDLIERRVAPKRALSVVFHGGDICTIGVKRAAMSLLGPVLHEYYGTSRGTLTEITTAEWLANPGSVGKPLPGVNIRIMRRGSEVPAGQMGEIWVRPRAFRDVAGVEEYLRTGDAGYLDEKGYLFVLGRVSDTADLQHAVLEHRIRALPLVTDVALLPSDPPVCYVETGQMEQRPELTRAIRAVARRAGLAEPRVVVAEAGSLIRTMSGKLRRSALSHAGPDVDEAGEFPSLPG